LVRVLVRGVPLTRCVFVAPWAKFRPVICRRANVKYFTPHDLRRSRITNWAKRLPIQTV
jgi:hypothetical protein